MTAAVPEFAELLALQDWGTVDFISDLHLCESQPATFEVWQRYMQSTKANAVVILGDLFEVWVGDDVVRPNLTPESKDLNFEARCELVLQDTGKRLPLFFMHGNRDFLIGQKLMQTCHATLLADPTILSFPNSLGTYRYVLSHGDMLCLKDTKYLAFRDIVRQPTWQQDQLAKPSAERQEIGRQTTLIHGHTHQPADHDLGDHLNRIVMTDWDVHAVPARAEVLRLDQDGFQRISLI